MTMNVNSEAEIIKFTWNIDSVIGVKSWVCSEQFYSAGTAPVSFDLGLRQADSTPQRLLYLRVRKNNLRQVKDSIQIDQIHTPQKFDNPPKKFDNPPQNVKLSKFYSRVFSNSSIPSIPSIPSSSIHASNFNNTKPSVTRLCTLERNRWKESLILNIREYTNESSKVLPDDKCNSYLKMTIECKIILQGFISEQPEKIMPINFHKFLNADVFNDITLIVDGKELPAHKVILSVHSPYFNAMLTTDMKEVKENRITIKNFSLDIITEMLEFFYTGKTNAIKDVDVALKMIEVAAMYQIINLIEICERTLLKNMNIDNVLSITNVADDFNLTQLRHKGIEFIFDNKNLIVKLPEFKDLCQNKPLLMFELMKCTLLK
ncbi:TD and POZ domain-containing protein 2-like [Microplitis mediator]|uniref:TD and POZ domain-containing protein 2-like n=1 Tax=Microplitis mediator TaxID=375433 RepID=UPI00255753E0|nr:TD and POZ domain-containing protein 2-like [Microplitis mediator]